MKCPRCQQENPPQAKFCLECGAPVDGAAPSPKSYADLKGENEELRRSLGEAHAQVSEASARETATSDILRVISSSPTDVQPVFDAIVRSTGRLCRGVWSALYQSDGTMLHLVGVDAGAPEALANPDAFETWRRSFPISVDDRSSITSHAIGERRIISIGDIEAHPDIPPRLREASRTFGIRSCLFVPLLRGDAAIGAIGVTRPDPEPFTER
jgi:GAF domain-containing protein